MSSKADDLLRRAERDPLSVSPRDVVRFTREDTLTLSEAADVITVLAEKADESPLRTLEPFLTGDDHDLRIAVTVVIIKIGSQQPGILKPLIPDLVHALEDDRIPTSTQLLRALAVVAPAYPGAFQSSVETLLSLLADTGRDGREQILSVLYYVSEDEPDLLVEYADVLQERIALLEEVDNNNNQAIQGSRPNDVAVREIENERFFNDRIRVLSVQTLANVAEVCPNPGAVIHTDRIADLAEPDRYPQIRSESLALFGTVAKRSPAAVRDMIPTLSEYTTGDDEQVAGKAAWTLSVLAEEYPTEVAAAMRSREDAVVTLMESETAATRGEAVGLLAYLAETEPERQSVHAATPRLIELLTDEHDFVRGGAILTLRSLEAKSALDELRRVSETDPSPDIRHAATKAVQTIGAAD